MGKLDGEVIALYRGDKFVDVDTRKHLVEKYQMHKKKMTWLLSPSVHEMRGADGNALLAYRVNDEDDNKGENMKKPYEELLEAVQGLESEYGPYWFKSDEYLGSHWDIKRRIWLSKYGDKKDATKMRKAHRKYKYTVVEPNNGEFICYRLGDLELKYTGSFMGYDQWKKWFNRKGYIFYREKL